MKIAIMTDSTAYIPKEIREQHQIYMIPLNVIFSKESFKDEIDITTDEFYKKMKEEPELPTTSQPSVGEAKELLEEIAKDYDAVISIHISKKMSGTFHSIESAAGMVENLKVYTYDTEHTAMPQGFFVLEAVKLVKENKSPEEVIKVMDQMKQKTRAYFMVDDLSNLQRGGRIGGAQALVGSLLGIKPILHLVDGEVEPFEKIRTRRKAISRIMNMLLEDAEQGIVEKVAFIHGNNESAALELQQSFAKQYPSIETMISYFGPVVGTHLGANSIGATWYTT